MKAVLHIPTGRLVYRESPEQNDALTLANAIVDTDLPENELVVVEVDKADWDRELAQVDSERPVPVEVRLADVEARLKALEKRTV